MARYGIFSKSHNRFIETYNGNRFKDLGSKYSDNDFIHIEFMGAYEDAHSWNGSSMEYDSGYAPEIVEEYKIYDYLPKDSRRKNKSTVLPIDIDYKTGLTAKLHPVYTYVKGELQNVEYYGVYDESEPVESDRFKEPVVSVDITYERDSLGFAKKRTTNRSWYQKNGSINKNKKKTTKKYYDNNMTIVEGKRRRGNIVNNMTLPIMGMLIQTELIKPDTTFTTQESLIIEGRRWLASHKPAFIDFVDDSNPTISTEIANDTTSWLDNVIDGEGTTIRDYMLNELNVQSVI